MLKMKAMSRSMTIIALGAMIFASCSKPEQVSPDPNDALTGKAKIDRLAELSEANYTSEGYREYSQGMEGLSSEEFEQYQLQKLNKALATAGNDQAMRNSLQDGYEKIISLNRQAVQEYGISLNKLSTGKMVELGINTGAIDASEAGRASNCGPIVTTSFDGLRGTNANGIAMSNAIDVNLQGFGYDGIFGQLNTDCDCQLAYRTSANRRVFSVTNQAVSTFSRHGSRFRGRVVTTPAASAGIYLIVNKLLAAPDFGGSIYSFGGCAAAFLGQYRLTNP